MVKSTVLTDASFDRGVSGWAAYVRVDGIPFPIKRSGPLRVAASDSTEAEMYAALNGIWIAVTNGATSVLLRTDCDAVIGIIEGRTKAARLVGPWRAALARYAPGLALQAQHVKGHGRIKCKATFANSWCDKHAVAARKKKQKEDQL